LFGGMQRELVGFDGPAAGADPTLDLLEEAAR
jgi:hypothetical protein